MLINNICYPNKFVSIVHVIPEFLFGLRLPWKDINKLCTCVEILACQKFSCKWTLGLTNRDVPYGLVTVTFCTDLSVPTKALDSCPSSSLQPCQIPAAPFTDLSRFPRALYTKALFLQTRTAALPTVSPAPGMDFPAIQTALCLRLGPPTPWTPPLAMAFHLRSVPCFQTDDLLCTRTE